MRPQSSGKSCAPQSDIFNIIDHNRNGIDGAGSPSPPVDKMNDSVITIIAQFFEMLDLIGILNG